MGTKKKPTAWILVGLYVAWTGVLQPLWNLNVERMAEKNGVDKALVGFAPMTWLSNIWGFLPGSFAAGFVTGALIFAYWDNMITAFRRYVLRQPLAALVERDDPVHSLWAGRIEAHLENMERDGRFLIVVSIANFGTEELILKKVTGAAIAHTHARRIQLDPPVPEQNNPLWEGFAGDHYGTLSLYQYLSAKAAAAIYEGCEASGGVLLDLREVFLIFTPKNGGEDMKVDLRHGLRLRRGYEHVGSNEITFSD